MYVKTLALISFFSVASSTPLLPRANPTSTSYTAPQQFGTFASTQGFAGPLGPNNIGFYMQEDGNFVAYRGQPSSTSAVWSSGSGPYSVCAQANQCALNFQEDGNLVIHVQGSPVWSTGTGGGTGYTFMMNDAPPYIVIYKSNGQVAYSSGGASAPPPPICGRGENSPRCNA